MILAHGLGGSTDLPIPVTYALIGGAWALAASFVLLLFAWRRPRLDPTRVVVALPRTTVVADSAIVRGLVGTLSVLLAGTVAAASVWGPQDSSNALLGTFYVLVWVGIVPASLLLGPFWRIVSPMRALHRVVCGLLRRPTSSVIVAYRREWGCVPAVVGLFAFVWLELASPDSGSVSAVRLWCAVYVLVMAVGAAIFGDEWFSAADPFEVYSDTVSRLSPLARDAASGVLTLRSPLDGAVSLPVQRGTVAVLAVLLGSTAFDSIGQIPAWRSVVDDSALGSVPTRTLGLIAVICVVGAAFWSAARATGGVSRVRRSALPGLLAHSLIPIVVGYMTAHYLTYFVEKGQQTIISLSDPLGNGANVLWLRDASVSYVLSNHPSVVAGIAVLAVVVGHLVGITLAHDASLRILPKEHAATGQLAMMVVMVLYTFGGLFLLFGA
ncbi:hypothetical protein QM616_23610 [Rhodococcus fascians]|uniref:hypothetical protein n=1 Tax=Rhodococcoides fascians TaxID=1828 RepID=UPI0024B85955|nr:hypothetical protein [Rhodococcus fascians]MDJ0005717.1 hypothetical protein [Rhodococcus fascians]